MRLPSMSTAAQFPDCAVRAGPRARVCPCARRADTAAAAAEACGGMSPGKGRVRRSGYPGEPDGAAPPHPPIAVARAPTASPRGRQPSFSPPGRPASRRCPHPRTRRAVPSRSRRTPPASPSRPSSQRQARAGRVPGGREGDGLLRRRARQPHRSPQPCSISVPTTTP